MDTLRIDIAIGRWAAAGPFTVATFIRSPDEKITAKKSARHTRRFGPAKPRGRLTGSQRSVTPALAGPLPAVVPG
jgi:hypothetical protein